MYAYKYRVALRLCNLKSGFGVERLLAPLVVGVSVIEKHILGARHNAPDSSGAERGAKLLREREIYVLFEHSVDTYRAAVLAAVTCVYYDRDRTLPRRIGDRFCRLGGWLTSASGDREEKQKDREEK